MSFKEIKGHQEQIRLLKTALKQNRIASAYLFLGEEGIGKRFVAKTFAKAINCLKGDNTDSCDGCISCKKIENLNHPDIHWITPEGTAEVIKIDQIRQLKNNIFLKPIEAKKKIFLIDQADYLTAEASNAFLKILEEPPADSLIILIASKKEFIFKTILSRCQKITFSSLNKDQLKKILYTEFSLDSTLSHYLSYFYEGRIGKALALKDRQVINNKNRVIDNFVFPRSNYRDEEFDKQKYREDLNILIGWFRDIYLVKAGLSFSELINIDRKNDLLKIMGGYSFAELDSIINYISEHILCLEQNVNPKLLLSNLKVRLWRG